MHCLTALEARSPRSGPCFLPRFPGRVLLRHLQREGRATHPGQTGYKRKHLRTRGSPARLRVSETEQGKAGDRPGAPRSGYVQSLEGRRLTVRATQKPLGDSFQELLQGSQERVVAGVGWVQGGEI